jgi:hypothetical protein
MAEILPTTLPETTASSLLNEAITPASWNLANPGKIFQTLRDAITDPAWDPYVVLGAIAEAAHALSEANAAALAMRRANVFARERLCGATTRKRTTASTP